MRISDLDYHLPADRIAIRPAEPRDHSRLLVVSRNSTPNPAIAIPGLTRWRVEHHRFYEILSLLQAGDLLVVNNTHVVPAKLFLRRHTPVTPHGALIQGLFVREIETALWEVLLRTRGKVKLGEQLRGGPDGLYRFTLEQRLGEGLWRVRLSATPGQPLAAAHVLDAIGHVPLPPYIVKQRLHTGAAEEQNEDRQWYQTVFASAAGHGASVAAPTAGLHFTPELLAALDAQGVQRVAVDLEVGPGTFLPVETDTLEEHIMHHERYSIPADTVAALRTARSQNRRIVVVGTTAVRTLEAAADTLLNPSLPSTAIHGETDLKIAPGYTFRLTDALITNFHLPKSTLMALVAAFLGDNGVETLKELYAVAIREGYRFYSYGDAMMIK